MKKCNHCDGDIGETDVFCAKCGNMVDGSKQSSEFIRKKSDFVVLGDDKKESSDFILKEEKPTLKKLVSLFNPKKKHKPDHYNDGAKHEESINEVSEDFITTTADVKSKKFFITRSEDEESDSESNPEPNKDKSDDFIIEGYEGVYYSTTRLSKAKMVRYGYIAVSVVIGVLLLFFLFNILNSILFPPLDGPCPYGCCVGMTYEDKLCPGYSVCEANKCVIEACPSDYECCSGTFYQERRCDESTDTCNSNFVCEKKECPYECCTEKDVYSEKTCADDSNCINNRCYLQPCPFECCEDEANYNDKSCSTNYVCAENSCELGVVYDAKKFAGFVKNVVDLVI